MIGACLYTLLLGAVSLGPQPITPNVDTDVWVSHTNDSPGSDDGYTGSFVGGVQVHSWRLAAAYDMLTERPALRRADQITAALSYTFLASDITAQAGLGARWTGNFGGQLLQNEWHRFASANHVELSYDDSAWRPLAVAGGLWASRAGGNWATSVQADLVASYDFIEVEAIGRIAFRGCVWAGPRYALHAGEYMTATGDKAFDAWGGLGLCAGVVLVDTIHLRWTWSSDRAYGTLSLEF